MGLLRTALIGAAVYGIVKYVTKKDANGKSVVDDIKEKAPEWVEKAKNLKDELKVELEKQRY
ncbi:YtxH domain-containing protein [Pedobacter sp. MC2016-24]|uniref:YtxH domain-containing protein n=1 Tax=Pedobacter sp. MC2016-24 TaxID=2780090 RepID=UPI00187E3950|nr:YtxH domain-containing protein [Pedobacter sp. MC2016-24]MBE9598221.1 YtxH domain-containing protein [Pedobacter sp. MC2016-24]